MTVRERPASIANVAAVLALLVPVRGAAAQQSLARASVDSSGVQANSESGFQSPPAISADGRHVAFDSAATNLVPHDDNKAWDVFVHDRVTGATVRVSVDSAGVAGNDASFWPVLSSDGRFVAFESAASNLVANDLNNNTDVFLHDRDPDGNGIFDEGNGITTLVSVRSNGTQGNSYSMQPSISADGSLVAFFSDASNLVRGDTNWVGDVFLHDNNTGITTRVSVTSSGGEGDLNSFDAWISADGTSVAFASYADDLFANDTNLSSDVFVRDLVNQTTTRVSVDSAGNGYLGDSLGPLSISSDGKIVGFCSSAPLVGNDKDGSNDVFVHDRTAGTTTCVSVDATGNPAGGGYSASLSADGGIVAFESYASNLVSDDTNGLPDIFVHDRTTGVTTLSSISCSGNQGNATSYSPALSADGLVVAFTTDATTLVGGDRNGFPDVIVDDRSVILPAASWSNYGAGFPGTLGVPSLTASANPVFGTTIDVVVDDSSGQSTTGFACVGFSRTSIPTSVGGTLLVDFKLLLPVVLTSNPTLYSFQVPRDDDLCGVALDLQWIERDPGAAKGFSFTPGLELVIGL